MIRAHLRRRALIDLAYAAGLAAIMIFLTTIIVGA